MSSLLRLFGIELIKSLKPDNKAAGARDFLLVLVFAILAAIALSLGLSVLDAAPKRMTEMLLGALPESSWTPVRVRYHPDRITALDAVTREDFFRRKEFGSFMLSPRRELSLSQPPVRLPGADDQGNKIIGSWTTEASGFNAWAIPMIRPTDPLWEWAARRNNLKKLPEPFSRVLIASRKQFEDHFNYEAYRRFLLQDPAATALRRFLPEPGEIEKDITSLKKLILLITEGKRNVYQDFTILWVKGLPLPEDVPVVLPLSFTELVRAAHEHSDLPFYSEAGGKPLRRISSIEGEFGKDGKGLKEFKHLAACLGAVSKPPASGGKARKVPAELVTDAGSEGSYAEILTYDRSPGKKGFLRIPFRKTDVTACIEKSGLRAVFGKSLEDHITVNETETEAARFHWIKPGWIETDCRKGYVAQSDFKRSAPLGNSDPNRTCKKLLENTSESTIPPNRRKSINNVNAKGYIFTKYYEFATVNVKRSYILDKAVKSLLSWKLPLEAGAVKTKLGSAENPKDLAVLRLAPSYERLLVRNSLLKRVASSLKAVFFTIFAMLGLLFMSVIGFFVVSHRKRQYGLIIMSGISQRKLKLAVLSQFILISFASSIIGTMLSNVIISHINNQYRASDIYLKASGVLGVDEWKIFNHLSFQDLIIVFGIISVFFFLSLLASFYFSKMRSGSNPMQWING